MDGHQRYISKISQCFTDVTVAAATNKGKLFGRGAGGDANYDPSVFNSKTSHYHADGSGVTAFGQGADNTYSVPVYAVTSQTSGLTVAETNASVTFNDTRYFAANATVTLTADADKVITAFTATGAAGSTVAPDNRSATVTLGSSDVTVTATLQTVSGTCGDNLTWSLAKDGNGNYTRLTISGTGAMKDYKAIETSSPWYTDAPWGNGVTSVTIGNSVTGIGRYAFIGCQSLATATIGNSVTTIGQKAFDHCDALTTVTLPASVTSLNQGAFYNCVNLERIDIGHDGAVSLAGQVFENDNALQYIVFPSIAAEQANTTGRWSAFDEKRRAKFGNQHFGVTKDKTNTAAYAIATAADLRNLAAAVNDGNSGSGLTFRQTDDINLASGGNFTPIGKENDNFSGTYDGGGKAISGLTVNTNSQNAGLFGEVKSGTVKNVRLLSPIVTSTGSGEKHLGALIGELDGSATNCYYYGGNQSNAIGYIYSGATVTRVSAAHLVTPGDNVTIQTAMADDLGFSYSGTDYWREGAELTLSNTLGDAPAGYEYTATAGTIDGSTLTVGTADATVTVSATLTVIPWSGEGTQSKPWVIRYPSQLDLLASRVNGTNGETHQEDGYFGKYFELGADITYSHGDDANLAKYESNYTAIGGAPGGYFRSFNGNFDGRGHTVSGIRIYKGGTDTSDGYQGLFGYTDYGATIRGITLADARITGYNATGGIVGRSYGTVSHCHVAASVAIHAVQNDAKDYGGIVGFNDNQATVSYCTSAATLTKTSSDDGESGGIVGINWGGTLSHNLAIGAVVPAATDNTHGAICGWNRDGTLQNNYYLACTVAGVENATDAGCGIAYKIGDFTYYYYSADVTDDYGAVPALRDNADNSTALALLAALATAGLDGSPLDLGWGAGKYPMQLAGRKLYKDGAWNTLCLPFPIADIEAEGCPLNGATVRELDDASINGTTLNLTFGDATTEIEAGVPYIVKWADGTEGEYTENPVFLGVTVDATDRSFTSGSGDTQVRFIGTYDQKTITDEDQSILFLSAGNTLYYPSGLNGGVTINPFRAYFKIGEDETMARQLTAFNLSFGDSSESTGIVEITNPAPSPSPTGVGRAAWYTLDGRRLDGKPTKRGLYVHGGRKVVVP